MHFSSNPGAQEFAAVVLMLVASQGAFEAKAIKLEMHVQSHLGILYPWVSYHLFSWLKGSWTLRLDC
jgi:hypothetical protein